MMRSFKQLFTLVLLLVLFHFSTYTVGEQEQALLIELGRVRGEPVNTAGLHFRVPFLHEVRYFDKRILQWDGDRGEIPTLDKKFIWVDSTARWRIKDALMFYKTVRDLPNARLRMGAILDGVVKDTVSSFNLIEVVRTSNDILKDLERNKHEATKVAEGEETALEEAAVDLAEIEMGREKIGELMAARAREELSQFGIELIDIQLRSIAYKEVVEQKVYARMISERERIATKIRSSGKGEEARILGKLDLTLKGLESEAYRKSAEIKGKAEAEALRILAVVLKDDAEFYEFVKTLETYRKTLGEREFVLSGDEGFLRLLHQNDSANSQR